MTATFFLWLFAYAFVWWLLWFLVLPLQASSESLRDTQGENKDNKDNKAKDNGAKGNGLGVRLLKRKALFVSLSAALLTTLLLVVRALL